jgi:tRNA(fMet)-specific endonuclease VapC
MVVLDTDYVSLMEWANSPEAQKLPPRLEQLEAKELATTIISYEEQTRGWLSVLAQSPSIVQRIQAYRRLEKQLANYCKMIVLAFDERAATEFQRLRQARLRIGTMDLKIAAIVLSHDATLLSRNLVDFRKVPGLKVEDWTA